MHIFEAKKINNKHVYIKKKKPNKDMKSLMFLLLFSTGFSTVLSEINGLYLNVVKEQLKSSSYNTTVTTVSLFNETGIQLMINFGDGTPPTILTNIISTGVGGYTYIINHIYYVCGLYTITTYGSNIPVNLDGATNYSYSNSTNVTVFCPMSALIVKTTPISLRVDQKEYIVLSIGKPFILRINQDSGSYRNFSIDWGDGTYSFYDQSVMNLNEYSPVSFQLIRSYEKENIYNFSVTSSNALETLIVNYYIDVKFCSMPDVSFFYETNPVTIFRSVSNDFTATVDNVRQGCKAETSTFFWKLYSYTYYINSNYGILSQQKVTYTIKKNSLNFGFHYLILWYSYGKYSSAFNVHINVIFLPLSMSIQTGVYARYAYRIQKENNSYFQNFTISAMPSYDPDNQESGIQNISFIWSCKIASDFLEASYVMGKFKNLNLTYSSDTCFNQAWMDIPSNSPEIKFSTQQFLEGIVYHIRVCGKIIAGKDIYFNELTKTGCFIQEFLIIAQSVPIIALRCISNCDEKMNLGERVIYSFICSDCAFEKLAVNWTIKNDSGVVPLEISSVGATTTGFLTPNLTINKDILLESARYTFIVAVGFADEINRSIFKFTKTTSTKPTSGYCNVDPMEGYALETKFNIFCNKWNVPYWPRSNMFFYDNGKSSMNLSNTTTTDYPMLNAEYIDQPNLTDFILEPGDENNNFNVRIIIKMRAMYEARTEIFYIKVVPKNPKNITNLLTDNEESCNLSAIFVLKDFVLSSGYLTKLKLKVSVKGTLEVAVLQATDFSFLNVSLLNQFQMSNAPKIVTALVVKKYLFLLNDPGVLEISFENKNSDIQENDMIWIDGNGALIYNKTGYEPMNGIQLNKTITFFTCNASSNRFFILFFISQPFDYLVPINRTGLPVFFVNVSSYLPSFQRVDYSFPIQIPVSGLQFAENNPFPKNIAGYMLNSLLSLKAVIQNGSDVRYSFDIPKLNYSINISSGDTVNFTMTNLGVFVVYLTAANHFSSVNTSIDIVVSSEINGLYLNVVKEQLQFSNYNTTVTLFNGTEVVLMIDFGDGTPPTILTNVIGTGVGGDTYIINHTYSACNVYTVTTYAYNILVHLNEAIHSSYSNSTNITVFCLMSPLVVKTTPSFSLVAQKQWIKLSLGKPFILNIYQDIGSYRNYSVYWGDGTSSLYNQSVMNLKGYSPASFQLIHSYENENTYNLIVTSSNALQTLSLSYFIEVLFCSVPEVRFSYGTILDPVTVFRSVLNDFTATVDSVRQYCKNESFSFQWTLNSSISAISSIEGILSQQKVTYTILKNSLDFGIYYLKLRYFYGDYYYDYTAYINVTFLPLSMSISNGFFASYAYKIKHSYFQNFTISAMSSYDPDNQESGIKNITFTWSCKVSSDFLEASYAMENFTKLNLNYSSYTCFNQTWIGISSNSSEMNFSTQQFLEATNYYIKVCGIKVAGRDIFLNELTKSNCFIQEILIIAEDVPVITLTCISNCDEKLNFKERVVYSFICADCAFQRLAAEWIITNDYGVVPSEILLKNATTTGFHTPSLVINKDILHESTNYTFTLLVGFAYSINRAKFKFTKTTCTKPTSGFCYVNLTEGYALETKFSIFCNDWKDQDGLLSYMFFYDNGQPQRMNLTITTTIDYPILNAASTDKSNLIDFMLGPGDQNNDFKIRIIIKVSGKCKAYNENFYFIKVFPNSKPKIIADLLSNVNLLDVQSVTNLAQAISLNINKNSVGFYNENSNVKNQKKLSDLQEARSLVISLLNNLVIKDLNSFKSVSDTLVVTSQYPQEMAPHAQNQAADVIVKLASLFTKDNFKGVGADNHDIMTQPFVNSVSNLFQAGLNNNNTGFVLSNNQTTADALSNLSKKNSNFVSKLSESLEKYFLSAQSYKVPGENATVGETKQFVFVLKKDFSSYLSNTTIGSVDGGFTLPDSSDMFNKSVQTKQVLVHNVRMKEIVYTWDTDRSQNILSESQSLSFSDVNGSPIEVSNSSQPIHIAIKNMPEKMFSKNISISMPYDLHHVKLPLKPDCNMLLKFLFKNDPNNLTTLLVYIQYGKVATKSDHDIMLNISSKHGVVMRKNSNVNVLYSSNQNMMNFSEVVTKNITLTGYKSFSNIFANKINGGLKRNQDAYVNNDSTLVLWNFNNATYAFLNSNELHLTFSYSGPMPDKKLDQNSYTFDEAESYGTFDYEMKSYCVDCNYWNESVNKWMSDGCQLEYYSTSFLVTKCKCTHLTTFGSFFVFPNPFPKFSISKLKAGYTLLVTVVIIIMLWILGLLLTRRIEKYDASKVGVCPLLDNLHEDKYLYKIVVNTGSQRNAGTKSNIFYTITGNVTDSGLRCLKGPEKDCFQRSSCSVLIMATQSTLGDLDFIQIWHDNSEGGWYIKNIVITDLQTKKKFLFIGHRWIATNCNPSSDCVIPVASIEESTNFTFVFKTKFCNKFLDEHLWFSIFASPSKSNFTRCQRLSVAVSLMMTSMAISTFFYKPVLPAYPATVNKTVFLLLVSSLAKLPIELLLIKMFRSRLSSLKNVKSNSNKFIKLSMIGEKKKQNKIYPLHNVSNENPNEQKKMVKKKSYLFNWCLYIGWFITVGITFVCGFIVLLYGLEFGNAESLTWLSSVAIDLAKDTFITEPMKIFVLAIITALVDKKIDEETIEIENAVLDYDEVWLHRMKCEISILKNKHLKLQPIDPKTLKMIRELKLKHQKINAIIAELAMYALYASLVFFIGHQACEGAAFFQTKNVKDLFNLHLRPGVSYPDSTDFNKIQSSKDFWPWMEDFFLPQVYPDPWYNLSELNANTKTKDFPGKLFLNDLNSKIVNGIRVRQVRVQPISCIKPNLVAESFKIDCISQYASASEETRDFYLNWTSPKQSNSTENSLKTPWSYQTWQELDGYPYATDLNTYYGGGYVIEIFPKWNNKALLKKVRDSRWIDRQTRALIIEFALFNAATNYFDMITMVLEFPASGGVVSDFSIITFKLSSSTKELGTTMLVSLILFILMMLVITVRECRFLYRTGWVYFLEFWNQVEAAIIIFSCIAVGFFFYKDSLSKLLLEKLSIKKPETFINFQFASYWNLTYVNIVALIIFFVTLKFIKLLRFNRRISMLSSTLKSAWYPLSMFGIICFIILCCFIFSANIMFGAFIDGYQTYFKTFCSIISLSIGKFNYRQFGNANPVLGPIFFLIFNITYIWIVINMFVSILIDAFKVVYKSLEHEKNDYEMVDFILEHLKDWLGFKSIKNDDMTHQNIVVNTNLYSVLDTSAPVTSERKLKKTFCDLCKVNKERLHADETTANDNPTLTLIERTFSKYDYLLNDNEVDLNESLNKFIVCANLLYKSSFAKENNKVSKNVECRTNNVKTDAKEHSSCFF
ncbi:uncharacterized protein LOC105846130 isoform X4 [Hydra vulgaris]|uniref:Uncharacterized protein LOC105846130 isoform X4 n=1 Tax=Hydra vulgaris TaxID=6087 RepID=A0ABM4CEW7_HYDVU